MLFCKIPTLRLRICKLHTLKQLILVIIIIALVCIAFPETFHFAQGRLDIQRADSQIAQGKAYKRKCLLPSLDNTAGCEEVALDSLSANGFSESNKKNEMIESKDGIEAGKKDIHLAIDVGVDVKTFAKRGKAVVEENILINSSIYREIPPVYDDLIKVTMNTKTRCKDAGAYNVIIAVHTAPSNFQNRAVFRWLYGDLAKTKPYRYKLIFFIGLVTNTTLQDLLHRENEQHDDLVQGNFIDAYINMTFKAIMVFNYLDQFCKGVHGLFRVDDDVFMNINSVFQHWESVQQQHYRAKTLMCYLLVKDRVLRTGKWAVPRALIPEGKYEFLRCPGYFAAITVDLIHPVNEKAREMPFFWIDDIVMLGLVPNAISGVSFHRFNKWMAKPKQTNEFENCVQTSGANCTMLVGITKIENFKMFYGYISGSIPLKKQ